MTDVVTPVPAATPIGDVAGGYLRGRIAICDASGNILDSSAATNAFVITPHATNALSTIPRAIYFGTGGDITLRASGSGADVLFKAVPTGSVLAVRAQYVRVSGTTAADLVGLA